MLELLEEPPAPNARPRTAAEALHGQTCARPRGGRSRSGGASTFVAVVPAEPARILGFCSVSPGSLAYVRTPELLRQRLGRYDVPVFRLGRLAVDRSLQGQGLRGQLLLPAGRRCLSVAAEIGGVARLIDAEGERAAAWYASYGAVPLDDAPLSLLLPTVAVALDGGMA